MRFHDVRFPTTLSFGSLGGPERRTEIVRLANGFEERNSPWNHSLRRYDAGVGMRSLDDIGTLIAFFEARRGQLYAFRWKDWSDFKSCRALETPHASDQLLSHGDGVAKQFQLVKRYESGGQSLRSADHETGRWTRSPWQSTASPSRAVPVISFRRPQAC